MTEGGEERRKLRDRGRGEEEVQGSRERRGGGGSGWDGMEEVKRREKDREGWQKPELVGRDASHAGIFGIINLLLLLIVCIVAATFAYVFLSPSAGRRPHGGGKLPLPLLLAADVPGSHASSTARGE